MAAIRYTHHIQGPCCCCWNQSFFVGLVRKELVKKKLNFWLLLYSIHTRHTHQPTIVEELKRFTIRKKNEMKEKVWNQPNQNLAWSLRYQKKTQTHAHTQLQHIDWTFVQFFFLIKKKFLNSVVVVVVVTVVVVVVVL